MASLKNSSRHTWCDSWQAYINKLRTAMKSNSSESEFGTALKDCLDAYKSHLLVSAKDEALAVISGNGCTCIEIAFMWMGRWRPTSAVVLVYSTMGLNPLGAVTKERDLRVEENFATQGALNEQQLSGLNALQQHALQAESDISQQLAVFQIVRHLGYPLAWNMTAKNAISWVLNKLKAKLEYWKLSTWPLHVRLRIVQSIIMAYVQFFLPLLAWRKVDIDAFMSKALELLWRTRYKTKGLHLLHLRKFVPLKCMMLLVEQNALKSLYVGETTNGDLSDLQHLMDARVADLQSLLEKADELRLHTLRVLLDLLTPVQSAACVIAAFELVFALQSLTRSIRNPGG